MKKVSIILMLITVVSKVLGFFREWMLSATYGKSVVADAFIFSFNLPYQIFAVIIAAFVTGFIPMYTRVEKDKGEKAANSFLNNTLNTMLLIGIVFSVVVYFFAEPIIQNVFLRQAKPELLMMVVSFVKITIFTILFSCIIQLLVGFLQLKNSFIFPNLLGFPLNIIIISFIIFSRKTGPELLPIGIFLAFSVQALLLFGYARIKGYKFEAKLNFKDIYLKRMILLAIPLMIASGASSIGQLVINSLASGYDGGLSLLNYSTKLGAMVDGIFGTAIVSVVYPQLSRAISLRQTEKAQEQMSDSLVSILLFVLPAAVGLFVLALPISQFVYQSSQFDYQSVLQLVPVLQAYAFGIPFFSIYNLVIKVYYSYQDMKTPTYISIGMIGLLILISTILNPILGVPGIMLAQSISFLVAIIVQIWLLKNKFSDFNYREFFGQIFKILIACLVMGVTVYTIYLFLSSFLSLRLAVIFTILGAVFVYLTLVLMLHIKAVDDIIVSLRTKIKGSN